MLNTFQILGCSGGVPTQKRGVTCVIISTLDYDIMIDCGEGSYLRWMKAGYNWRHLEYILITHMHPDHIGGLFPFLFYRKIFNISSPLTLIGPPNLKGYVLDSFNHAGIMLNQDIIFFSNTKKNKISLKGKVKVETMEMKHKIPCWGYAIQSGNKKLVFVTDTLRNTNTIELAQEADVLIHEATFQHAQRDKAKKHFHTTEIQAMKIADSAKVKRLILTHFSQRLTDTDVKKWIWRGRPCVVFDERQKI